jgi:small subunit ribosomal protein S9
MYRVVAWGTGRRKSAVARARLFPGEGRVWVNGKKLEEYFPVLSLRHHALAPLEAAGCRERYDAEIKVSGGGISGQAGAVRHGLARALVALDPSLRPLLRKGGFLTRDPRVKERRKYGLKKARKAPQWQKR